ncbi:MAG: hypothetical protein LC687_03360 [Actinobacteria bacterium]|nr:hypothetical protein [Actinomycetota bacterium]
MTYLMTVRDYQIRCNSLSLPDSTVLVVDGMNGPNTRKQMDLVVRRLGLNDPIEMFDPSGITRVHWHWTASTYYVDWRVRSHYNNVFDHEGNEYDGRSPAHMQAAYDWRNKVGVSHTKDANTGAVGLAFAGMAGAEANWGTSTVDQGKYPLTWEGIDAMLKKTAEYCRAFGIKPSPWTTITHAEVQTNINIRQSGKWDIRCLPDNPKVLLGEKACGDILRARMMEKFWC